MSKTFTRIGKDIAMAVKAGGPDPHSNTRLRVAIQNAKGANMPKANVEAAIKKASNKDEKDFTEVVYEGYGPHGIAFLIETATDNPTRTVAAVRMHLTRSGGSLGTSGSVEFMFDRKGVFRFPSEGINLEELELELIDAGAEDIVEEEGEIHIYTEFSDFGAMQKALEDLGINVTSSELQRFPNITKEVTAEQEEDLLKLIDKLEEDDDVQAVYHTLQFTHQDEE